MESTAKIRLLGSLEVRLDDRADPLQISSPRQRALLALLALHAPSTVSLAFIVDAMWEVAPPTSRNVVQQLVSALRRLLGPDIVLATSGGYRLGVAAEDVDAHRFHSSVAAALDVAGARPGRETVDALAAALRMWSGEALGDLPDVPFVEPARRALYAERERAERAWASQRVDLGEGELALPRLEELHTANLLDESVAATLVRALASVGRVDESLKAYDATRRQLQRELGLDPGPELRAAHEQALRHQAPRRRTVVSVLTALPRLTDDLLGRDDTTARVRDLLSSSRSPLVTMSGPGGVGKTQLALSVAHSLAAERPVMWVDLVPLTTTDQIAAELAAQLGISVDGSRAQIDAVARAAYQSHLLVVLDNCEHITGAAQTVATLLAVADESLQVLVTTRTRLGVRGERVVELGGLPSERSMDGAEGAAVELFLRRASLTREDGETLNDVRTICRALDGLPLAVEIAAARAGLTGTTTMRAELSAKERLTWRGDHDTETRHRTLGGCIDWSLQLLPPPQRSLFTMLAVFPDTFDLEAVRGVCQDLLEEDVGDLLGDLVAANLVRTAVRGRTARFGLLATVRSVAEAELERSSLHAELQRNHARHFAARFTVAEQRSFWPPRTVAEAEAVDRELPNLDVAMNWLVAVRAWSEACDLTLSLCTVLTSRGRYVELERRLESLLASDPLSVVQRTRVVGWLSVLAAFRGDWARRADLLDQSYVLARSEQLHADLAQIWGGKAESARERGDIAEAARMMKEAMAAARASGDAEIVASLQVVLVDIDDAFAFHRSAQLALDVAHLHGNQALEGMIKGTLSHTGLRSREPAVWALCRQWGEEAAELSQAFRMTDIAVMSRSNAAAAGLLLSDAPGAADTFLHALEWSTRMGQEPMAVECIFRLATALAHSGDDAARQLAAAALRLAGPENDLAGQHRSLVERCFPDGLDGEGPWAGLGLDECIAGIRALHGQTPPVPLFATLASG